MAERGYKLTDGISQCFLLLSSLSSGTCWSEPCQSIVKTFTPNAGQKVRKSRFQKILVALLELLMVKTRLQHLKVTNTGSQPPEHYLLLNPRAFATVHSFLFTFWPVQSAINRYYQCISLHAQHLYLLSKLFDGGRLFWVPTPAKLLSHRTIYSRSLTFDFIAGV